jgi:hypothetical protein
VSLGQLGREVRIAARRGQVEAEQGLFAVVEFGDGGQHPGRHLRGAAAGLGVHEAVVNPRCAARQAVTRPMIPPPTTSEDV